MKSFSQRRKEAQDSRCPTLFRPAYILAFLAAIWGGVFCFYITYNLYAPATSSGTDLNAQSNPVLKSAVQSETAARPADRQRRPSEDLERLAAEQREAAARPDPTPRPTRHPTPPPTFRPTHNPTRHPTPPPTDPVKASPKSKTGENLEAPSRKAVADKAFVERQKQEMMARARAAKPVEERAYATNVDISDPLLGSHDREKVLERMMYWKPGVEKWKKSHPEPAQPYDKFLTHHKDCGGFNNIRMGFEYTVGAAWFTGRTLVLPPDTGWYLIDWGPLTRMKTEDTSGVSNFGEFFDLDDLELVVPTVKIEEFVTTYKSQLEIPDKYDPIDTWQKRQDWKKWLNQKGKELDCNMKWGPGGHYVAVPDIETVMRERPPEDTFKAHRDPVEYREQDKSQLFIHFPACDGGGGSNRDWRYLGQIATMAWFADEAQELEFRRIIRDHVHLVPKVFELASLVVAELGIFGYAGLHVRRNDLQYKHSFISSTATLDNIKPLILDGEKLYISTDELEEGFFQTIEEHHEVYRWSDFFGPGGKFEDTEVPRKIEGLVEMAICAGARIFFGTRDSTFSAYITRLRGYYNAPDSNVYLHNTKYTGDVNADRKRIGVRWGTRYMVEFPEMWDTIRDM